MESEINDGVLSGYLRKRRIGLASKYLKGKYILDIGCDIGHIIPYLPDDIVYHGVDANPNMLEVARQHYPHHTFDQLMLTRETMQQLPDKQFDCIFMIAIAEHLDAPIEVFKFLHSRLRSGGRIVITSPHVKSHFLLVWMAKVGLARNDKHEHEHYIDTTMLDPLINGNIFTFLHFKRFQFGFNQLWVLEKK